MNILLINPNQINPFEEFVVKSKEEFLSEYYPSLGVNLLATILRNVGHNVLVLDHLYQYLRTNYKSPIDIFEGIEDILNKNKIDIVGVSMITNTRKASLDVARIVKRYGKKVIIGGPHSIMYKQLLENYGNLIDYVVVGEGEISFLNLINLLDNNKNILNIEGVAFKTDNKIIFNKNKIVADLNTLPPINYYGYAKHMPKNHLKIISLFTSKGCPFNCTFCAHYWGYKYRTQSAEKIFFDIEKYIEKYSPEILRFEDDSFTLDKEKNKKLFDLMIKNNFNVKMDVFSRFDGIDSDFLKKFKKAGGRSLSLGIETGSDSLRNLMNKNISNKQIYEKVKLINKYKISFYVYLMFGYPGETMEDIRQTYTMIKKIKPTGVNCTITQIDAPNTPLFYLAKHKGIMNEKSWLNENIYRYYFVKGETLKLKIGIKLLFEKLFNSKKHWKQYESVVPYGSNKLSQKELDKLIKLAQEMIF